MRISCLEFKMSWCMYVLVPAESSQSFKGKNGMLVVAKNSRITFSIIILFHLL